MPADFETNARELTVVANDDHHPFTDVTIRVWDGTLIISREGRQLAWFAPGQWIEVAFL